jgi:hypothetical protein
MSWRQSEYFEIPYLDVENYEIDLLHFSICSADVWRNVVCIPIDGYGSRAFTIATDSPSQELKEKLEGMFGRRVVFILGDKEHILSKISYCEARIAMGGL